MDILSLTHNVRVGQEVEPGGAKAPERNLGKDVRETGSPRTRGAPPKTRADRKEASQVEQKPLQQALDLLEANLPIEPNLRDHALNKKIRPDIGIGLGITPSKLDIFVEIGKPKFKDLLAEIGVDVPSTLSTRSLTILKKEIVEKIDVAPLPTPVRRLIDAFLRTGNVPVAQASAPDVPTPVVNAGDQTESPIPAMPQRPTQGIRQDASGDRIRYDAPPTKSSGLYMPPNPNGIKERGFIEAPKPGVPHDMLRVPIKVAPELGPHKITVHAASPSVNLEAMADILVKGPSPFSKREVITTGVRSSSLNGDVIVDEKQVPRAQYRRAYGVDVRQVPKSDSAQPVRTADDGMVLRPDWSRPATSSAVHRPVTQSKPTAVAPGTLITPETNAGLRPRIDSGTFPRTSRQIPSTNSSVPLPAVPPKLFAADSDWSDMWPDFKDRTIKAPDLTPTVATSVSDVPSRTIDGANLYQRATDAVTSVHDSIIDHIQEIAASQGRGRVVIRLQPEELGSITVSVRSFGQRVEADIRASNDAVRDALVASRGDLVQSVESKGLSLDSFNVGQEANGEPQTSDQRADRQNDMRREFERFANVSQASHTDVPVAAAAPWLSPTTEAVDYTV